MSIRCLILFVSFFFVTSLFAQLNESIFDFSNLYPTSRLSASHGTLIAVNDSDISTTLSNPALINQTNSGDLLLSYNNFVSDINYINAAYGFSIGSVGGFVGYINYFDFGDFREYNDFGESIGEFSVADYQIGLSHGRSILPNFRIGATTKINYSNYYRYNSLGFVIDLAGLYNSPDNTFSATIKVANIGGEIIKYNEKNYLTRPSVNIAISQKLAKAPLRLSILYANLEKWNLTTDPALLITTDVFGSEPTKLGFNNFMKHFSFGGEFIPSKNFAILMSYSHKVRDELRLASRGGLSGFAFGLNLKVKKIKLQYALNAHAIKGMSNQLTIVTRLSRQKKITWRIER